MLIRIARRFRGPSNSGNGGYCCGRIANDLRSAKVTLRSPPPLDTDLELVDDEGTMRAMHGDTVVGDAVAHSLELDVPDPIDVDLARRARERFAAKTEHIYPECFVCGISREPGDGLDLHPGPVEDGSVVACDWTPHESLPAHDGRIAPEIVWAALDCPSYFGAASFDKPVLLGRLEGDVRNAPQVGERCVVVGWGIAREGRKIIAGSALYGAEGDLYGAARATWIELR